MINAQDLRAKKQDELQQQLSGLLHQQFSLRMQKGSGQIVSPHQLRQVRRDIARVKTVLNEKAREGKSA